MIPKIIHYVWLGNNPKSKLVQDCMESWEQILPDYQIMCWDENNFDIDSVPFVRQAYDKGLWAYASDYIRLHAVCTHGGIYLDTDVKVLQSLDPFLEHRAFLGWESPKFLGSFLIGAEAKHPWIEELLEYYNGRDLVVIPNVEMYTEKAKNHGMEHDETLHQVLPNDVHIYPQKNFCSRNYRWPKQDDYTLHYFDGNGYSIERSIWDKLHWRSIRKTAKHELRQVMGDESYNKMKSFFGMKK